MNVAETPVSCSVYRSPRRDFTYLYVPADTDFDDLPEALLDAFGTPEFVLSVELTAERELAQEDARTVLQNIAAQGYHLQMPPGEDQGDLL